MDVIVEQNVYYEDTDKDIIENILNVLQHHSKQLQIYVLDTLETCDQVTSYLSLSLI